MLSACCMECNEGVLHSQFGFKCVQFPNVGQVGPSDPKTSIFQELMLVGRSVFTVHALTNLEEPI